MLAKTKARSTRRKPADTRSKDALALLREDHAAVTKLFEEYERRKDRLAADKKSGLAQRICQELAVHAEIEEEIFYPALRNESGSRTAGDLLDEVTVEHASVKQLIAQIEAEEPDAELFDAKVKVLGEYVKRHVREEQSERLSRNSLTRRNSVRRESRTHANSSRRAFASFRSAVSKPSVNQP